MKELLQIFDRVPNLQILSIGNEIHKLVQTLQEELKSSGGEIASCAFDGAISLDMVLPNRKYEACIFYDVDYTDVNFVPLLLKVYDSLETTATVVFLNQSDRDLLFDLMPLLEEGKLQNANSIDLIENHSLVVAKKLQMWV